MFNWSVICIAQCRSRILSDIAGIWRRKITLLQSEMSMETPYIWNLYQIPSTCQPITGYLSLRRCQFQKWVWRSIDEYGRISTRRKLPKKNARKVRQRKWTSAGVACYISLCFRFLVVCLSRNSSEFLMLCGSWSRAASLKARVFLSSVRCPKSKNGPPSALDRPLQRINTSFQSNTLVSDSTNSSHFRYCPLTI